MFKIGKHARGFQRSIFSAKLTKPTLVTLSVVGIAQISSFTFAKCDAIIVTPVVEKISTASVQSVINVATTKETFWESMVSTAHSVLQNVKDAARYMERILAYIIFGAPLVGLLPANYLFGQSVPHLEKLTWGYLIWAIQKLGPCFIKLAQWASSRPDIFSPSLIAHLETLQDDVKVEYPMSVVESTLSEAFGEDWKSVLILDPKPIGSGSVAQVFRGILKKAEKSAEDMKVAVKMIHPHVEKVIKTDMELFVMMASLTDHFPSLEMLSLKDTCDQFAKSMNQQLDLRIEASHLSKFRKKFANESWAVFPAPIDGFITKHVLVESLMDGTPINYFMKLSDELGGQTMKLKRKLSDLGTRLILKMVFFDNYVHGDLHPGNLFVQMMPNGEPRLVVLDCGIVFSSKSEAEHEKLVDICLAFMKHDGYSAGKYMIENAELKQQKVLHEEAFCRSIQKIVDDSENEKFFEHVGEYFGKICDLARTHMVRLDAGYFKIAMALKVAEGVALALDRNIDLVTKCIPIVTKAKAMRALGIQKFPEPEPEDEFITTPSTPNSMNRSK